MVFPRRSHIALLERNQTERIGRKLFEFVLGMSVLQEFQSLSDVGDTLHSPGLSAVANLPTSEEVQFENSLFIRRLPVGTGLKRMMRI